MEVKIYDTKLKETDKTVKLNDSIWTKPMNADLVSQAVLVYQSNLRQATASAKGKGEVSGGGKKPWKQKGTGRARHGSTRSPLWVGGGVTFSPSGRTWTKRMNRKMKLAALGCVLSARLKGEDLMFVDTTNLDRSELTNSRETYVVVTSSNEVVLALRNLVNVTVVRDSELNAYNSMRGKRLLIDTASVEGIEARFNRILK